MSGKPPKTKRPETHVRAIERRSFLVAAPVAGLAAGAAALIGREEGLPGGADPNRDLQYSETPHIRAYYRRARF